jgi:hypothetical protein
MEDVRLARLRFLTQAIPVRRFGQTNKTPLIQRGFGITEMQPVKHLKYTPRQIPG